MTRISSYSLHECPQCKQIHIKPQYASISSGFPLDLIDNSNTSKFCKQCGVGNLFQSYKFLGQARKMNTEPPSIIEIFIRSLFKRPYVEFDVRKIYPLLD